MCIFFLIPPIIENVRIIKRTVACRLQLADQDQDKTFPESYLLSRIITTLNFNCAFQKNNFHDLISI